MLPSFLLNPLGLGYPGAALVAWLAWVAVAWAWGRATRPGFSPAGRHVLVTGGSAGLGLEFAARCVREGAKTVTIVARSRDKLDRAREGLLAHGSGAKRGGTRVLAVAGDVTSAEGMRRAVRESEEAHGGAVDYLVCCAGMAEPGYLEDQPDGETHRRQMEVNYFGVVNTVQAALPGMTRAAAGGGPAPTVMIVGSALSLMSFLGYTQYCASKFAVKGFADALRGEMVRHGVRVQLFLPSNMKTEGYEREERTKPRLTKVLEDGGAMSTPEDSAARMAAALASGNYITTEETLIYLCQVLVNGVAPRNNLPLELALLPVSFFALAGVTVYADYLARGGRAEARAKLAQSRS